MKTSITMSELIANQQLIINGFDLKETILNAINECGQYYDTSPDQLATEITTTLAQKMGIIQGDK